MMVAGQQLKGKILLLYLLHWPGVFLLPVKTIDRYTYCFYFRPDFIRTVICGNIEQVSGMYHKI